jgi:hypothetical protein
MPSSTPARAQDGDLPEWLLFSPSSLEPGHRHGVSPDVSYAEMVRRKGKATMEEGDSSTGR